MTVIDADNNQVRVGKGTTVIADGHTRKVYKDDETAFKRTGLNMLIIGDWVIKK